MSRKRDIIRDFDPRKVLGIEPESNIPFHWWNAAWDSLEEKLAEKNKWIQEEINERHRKESRSLIEEWAEDELEDKIDYPLIDIHFLFMLTNIGGFMDD